MLCCFRFGFEQDIDKECVLKRIDDAKHGENKSYHTESSKGQLIIVEKGVNHGVLDILLGTMCGYI